MSKTHLFRFAFLLFLFFCQGNAQAEDGYRLWQRYDLVQDKERLQQYRKSLGQVVVQGASPTLTVVKEELEMALTGLLGSKVAVSGAVSKKAALVAGTPATSSLVKDLSLEPQLKEVGQEGFLLLSQKHKGKSYTVIAANTEKGVLYGTFHLLRLLKTQQDIQNLKVSNSPKTKLRILNHWDNLDRTVERGYAGFSIWDWHKLPDYIDQRYLDYARANASIGINGTVLTNVNANSLVLTPEYLKKVKALADVFRPYGIKVYLTARFSSPIELGKLKTADPLNPEVKEWWKNKVNEIYTYVPDFGGFTVKANSEGQPGPQNYNRSHADGANMLAEVLAPKGGIVMWRAFVYDNNVPDDRHKQAYTEFKPLDGTFKGNVMVQVKNGAIDFQPREPFHPLFGAMPKTPLMMEFQITQEYLGQGTHLAYLAPMFKETLEADTYAKGKGSTVAKVVDGSLDRHPISGMAGVANIGNDINWTSHPFGQANWYAFGRLAWDYDLTSEAIADEWIKMTFSSSPSLVPAVRKMMMGSREAVVNYMTPMGLHHLMGWSHHYGPGPWIKDKPRADWTSVYYHRATEKGIGFDRTKTGSNALSQYAPEVQAQWQNPATCPEEFLLWFHHVAWDAKTKSGRTLWDELCYRYSGGVDSVRTMQKTWDSLAGQVDKERHHQVKQYLAIQEKDARWWRDACLLYFQTFSKRPIPQELEKPQGTLEEYMKIEPKFSPGI
ncbi:alpha-glucuronidase family glycosyl hydrolase [Rufibacter glacialis]|uniref:Xylan alpha-1,2-glucuronidase n=1 Tax=Rufibacter glacialis TaxID=1259555 RepID=A0A5M8Q944_9BACT|nr:alpha-glucuronidase family glycosyl hydrolase [Rufibacter glacialis]KAA6432485.1 alpha-glucuronidase [Rufibacter glacialis]GGK79069.1 xylan alpha-1,2-glucuronidase [Rufibacter glacialis]